MTGCVSVQVRINCAEVPFCFSDCKKHEVLGRSSKPNLRGLRQEGCYYVCPVAFSQHEAYQLLSRITCDGASHIGVIVVAAGCVPAFLQLALHLVSRTQPGYSPVVASSHGQSRVTSGGEAVID